MRRLIIYVLLPVITLSCSEDSTNSNQNSLIGLWVPYEIGTPDGHLQEKPFTT